MFITLITLSKHHSVKQWNLQHNWETSVKLTPKLFIREGHMMYYGTTNLSQDVFTIKLGNGET